jgi:hypothetical protein
VTLLALATGLQVAFGIMAALLLIAGVVYVVFGRDEDHSQEAIDAQAMAQADRRREAARRPVGPGV